jgi:hypothetical protein
VRDTTRYAYDPLTGGLATVTGQGSYAFAYDVAGRTRQITRGSTYETFDFDPGGRMYSRRDWSGSVLVHQDVTTFSTTTGEVSQVNAMRETVLQTRRGLGALAWVDTYDIPKGTRNFEYYSTDPLTNQISTFLQAVATGQVAPSLNRNETQVNHYEPHTGRLLSTSNSPVGGAVRGVGVRQRRQPASPWQPAGSGYALHRREPARRRHGQRRGQAA